MKVIGVIPARYKSSRFPGKPLALICGKPMIYWVYNQAKKAKGLDELIVATDDERIAEICREFDMKYMMTSENNSTGAERIAEVALQTDGDIYLNIQGDEPLIDSNEISRIISLQKECGEGYVGLKSKIDCEEQIDDPNIVKVVTDINGYALYFSRSPIPYIKNTKCVYRCMGLYAYKRDVVLRFKEWSQSNLELAEKGIEMLRLMEHGIKVKLFDTEWHSVGVDLPEHINLVEHIISGRGTDE